MQNHARQLIFLSGAFADAAGLVVVLAAAAAFYGLAWRPCVTRQREAQDQAAAMERSLVRAQPTLDLRRKLRSELAELTERARSIRERIPPRAEEAELLSEISRIADDHGLRMVDYRRGAVADRTTHKELRIGLRCEGDYAGMCHLLDRLDRLDRVCMVETLEVKSEASRERCAFDLSVVFYFAMRASGGEEKVVTWATAPSLK